MRAFKITGNVSSKMASAGAITASRLRVERARQCRERNELISEMLSVIGKKEIPRNARFRLHRVSVKGRRKILP